MPVLRPLKSGDQFQVALSGRRICSLSDSEPILQALRYVMVLVGVRASNLPNDHEKAILLKYIYTHYGGHTPEEIRLAFEKAINWELEVDDVTCYENFSVLYFSKIMNAYREWAREEFQNVSLPVIGPVLSNEQIEYEEEQKGRQQVEAFYQQIRQITKRVPEGIPYYFKDILVKDGILKAEDDLTTFFVERLGKGIENIYVKE